MPEDERAKAASNGTSTAAETPNPAPAPEREPGSNGTAEAPAAETHVHPNPSPTTDDTEADEAQRLLAGAQTAADFERIASGLGNVPTDVASGSLAEVPPTDPALDPEDPANLEVGKPQKRLRIAGLPQERQDLILKLAKDPNAKLEDLLPASAASSNATADAPPAAPTPAPPAPSAPATVIGQPPARTVADVQAEIDQLGEQQDAAYRSADMDKVADLNKQIRALTSSVPAIQQEWSAYDARFRRVVRESQQKATEIFPDVRIPDSELAKEMQRLDQELEKTDLEAFHHPQKPFRLASEAAANLGISPRKKGGEPPAGGPAPAPALAPTPPLKPAPVSAPTPRAASAAAVPPAPASGAARTTAPAPDALAREGQAALDSIKDTSGFSALLAGFK